MIGRRGFLASLAGVAGALSARDGGARAPARGRRVDNRLTARPHRPYIDPERGATVIGPHLDRSGVLYVPDSYRADVPAPLLVALHGAGGSASSWSRLHDACERRGMVMIAPDSRGRTWDRIQGDFGPDVGFIDSALRYVFDRCSIDESRIALGGFSDGASYALSLGPSNGDLFTHLLAWSPGFSAPADPIVGEPEVFVSHGTQDAVLRVELSRIVIVPMFRMDGYDIEYHEFDGRHEMPADVVTRSLDWFLDTGAPRP